MLVLLLARNVGKLVRGRGKVQLVRSVPSDLNTTLLDFERGCDKLLCCDLLQLPGERECNVAVHIGVGSSETWGSKLRFTAGDKKSAWAEFLPVLSLGSFFYLSSTLEFLTLSPKTQRFRSLLDSGAILSRIRSRQKRESNPTPETPQHHLD
ncbi:hypothetical protein KC361_g89 [Hortaea werneckii]|nr:hypothetical protein KC361_g89 [Hortaea werneckii]